MQILSVFEQPSKDNHVYVVCQGQVNDIACYRSNDYSGVMPQMIAFGGTKLTEAEFEKTLGCWDYEQFGLHYRR